MGIISENTLRIGLFLLCMTNQVRAEKAEGRVSNEVISRYTPSDLKINPNSGETRTFGNGIAAKTINTDFRSKSEDTKHSFTIILYSTDTDNCEVQVLQRQDDKFKLMPSARLKYPTALNGCIDLELKDLAGNGHQELIIQTLNGKDPGSPAILKWDGKELVDISPVKTITRGSISAIRRDFRQVQISDKPVQGKLVFFDFDPNDDFAPKKLYNMIDGEIKLVGTFDAVSLIPGGGGPTTIKPAFQSAGVYTLDVNNVSNHHRAVRAEITVNGVPILGPKDFCNGPPKNHNRDKDDGDDSNDDHMMGCSIKKDVYAIVPMQATNTMTVKIYGRSDSVLQVSLTKKP